MDEAGVRVGGLVVNRVLPDTSSDAFLTARREQERVYLDEIAARFSAYDRRMALTIAPPQPDEVPEFFRGYVALVDEADGIAALERQQPAIAAMARLRPEQAAFRYADGKWTVKGLIGHLADAERIFSYRLLRIARGDRTPLPSFDENTFAENSNADRRDIGDLAAEMAAIRTSTIALARSLDEAVLDNRGTVRAGEITARAQVFVTAGHVAHHLKILRDRYKIDLA